MVNEAAACRVPGVLTEPRSVWSVAQINRLTSSILQITFDREELRNGSRWPITLDRFTLAPIGYPMTSIFDDYGRVFMEASLRISVPGRQHYMRRPVSLVSFPMLQAAEPNTDVLGDIQQLPFGIVYRKFDSPVLLPQRGQIALDLSALPAFLGESTRLVSMGFHQLSDGPYGGEGRVTQTVAVQTTDQFTAAGGGNIPPFGDPVFGGVVTTANVWPPQMAFNVRTFAQQQSTRSGTARTPVTGMSVFIGLSATTLSDPPFSSVFSRIRTVDGDSHGEYWWRPGAPLSLVFDTITPALVFGLIQPITLEPGDTLDVELAVTSNVKGSPVETPNYTVGISFNGYCEIEG